MEYKSKLTTVQGNGVWKEFWKFDVTFENDMGGTIYRKTDEAKVEIGTEYLYTLNDKGTIKIVNPEYKGGGGSVASSGFGNDREELIVRQNSITNAVAYCRGSNCSPEEITDTAQIFRDWVFNKPATVKETPALEVTNDNPF